MMWTWIRPDLEPLPLPDVATLGARRLYLCMYFEGPWARLSHWLWRFEPATSEALERGDEEEPDLPDVGRFRDWLARKALDRDHRWRERYARLDIDPHPRWKVGGP